MNYLKYLTLFALISYLLLGIAYGAEEEPKVILGIDRLFNEGSFQQLLKNKRVGLVTNHTAINSKLQSSIDLIKMNASYYKIAAFFAPEHGLNGNAYADEKMENSIDKDGITIHSLYGAHRRPTADMLKGIDVLIFDIQDIGVRSYTYTSTLFLVMEECAKRNIKVIVTDRPNPMGGAVVDGLLLDPQLRSFIGYVNVTYCHGMTIAELASFFNQEYHVGCDLKVIPMVGWKRCMTFEDTKLPWIPTSPQVPEKDTPYFYATTGILGELSLVNIGVGYTLPFKVVGAPWIDATRFAYELNAQKFPGVTFYPIYYRPFFGSFAKKECQGVKIIITDKTLFRPVETQYLIMGILKTLYPEHVKLALLQNKTKREMFSKANGSDEVLRLLSEEKYIVFKLKKMCQDARQAFLPIRKKYLISSYN